MHKYIGNGAFLQGVPARDLTNKEWDALSKERQADLIRLGLYAAPERPKSQARRLAAQREADNGDS
jgi:hypothetical protein